MLMIAIEAVIDPLGKPLPQHVGGALHGFVERALLNHASYLIPVLRPDGRHEYSSLAIEPPAFGEPISSQLRFGCILFRDATQSWSVVIRAILEQASSGLNSRALRIDRVWVYEPSGQPQAVVLDGRLIDDVLLSESPSAWLRRAGLQASENNTTLSHFSLDFHSPLLLGSRGSIRHGHEVPWPTLKSLLDSIAKRVLALEPELAKTIGVDQSWHAGDQYQNVEAYTRARRPATQVQWPYSVHRKIFKPGIVGELIFVAQIGAVEQALLEWGQWMGVGQQTTMGCGRYVLRQAGPQAEFY